MKHLYGNSSTVVSRPRHIFACSSVALDYFGFLVASLKDDSSQVVAVTAVSENVYRRASRGSVVQRLYLRARMYIVYPLLLAVASLRAHRGDTLVVTSNTFFAPALVAALAKWRGVRIVHLIYDLFPDALEVAGRLRPGGLASRLLGCVTRINQAWADGTVYLGDFLRDYAERRWGRTPCPGVIPIATDVRLYPTSQPSPATTPPLAMHYGGQLGLMHDAESLEAGLRLLAASGALGSSVTFEGLISGRRAAEFGAALRGTPGVFVGKTLASDEWRRHVVNLHIGVVTLSPGGATVCLPSKTYAMMAAGLAIVAICPQWSDLARLVEDCEAGWVIDNAGDATPLPRSDYLAACRAWREPGAVAAEFRDRILQLVTTPAEVERRRQNAWRAIRTRFSPELISAQWSEYLASLPPDTAAGRQGSA